jgi:hypothetical protein
MSKSSRQLLLLERLVLRPPRARPGEAMFIGLRAQFPAETRMLTREFEFWVPPDSRNIAALRRFMGELTRLPERRRVENGEHTWRERADGSRPAATIGRNIGYGYRGSAIIVAAGRCHGVR